MCQTNNETKIHCQHLNCNSITYLRLLGDLLRLEKDNQNTNYSIVQLCLSYEYYELEIMTAFK